MMFGHSAAKPEEFLDIRGLMFLIKEQMLEDHTNKKRSKIIPAKKLKFQNRLHQGRMELSLSHSILNPVS